MALVAIDTRDWTTDSIQVFVANPAPTAVIASGTTVNSYFFHVDSVRTDFTRFNGTVFFDQEILAIIFGRNELNQSDSILGIPATQYSTTEPNSDFREFEGDGSVICKGLFDCATISTDLRSITLDLGTNTQIDQIRVISSPVPIPRYSLAFCFEFNRAFRVYEKININYRKKL